MKKKKKIMFDQKYPNYQKKKQELYNFSLKWSAKPIKFSQ